MRRAMSSASIPGIDPTNDSFHDNLLQQPTGALRRNPPQSSEEGRRRKRLKSLVPRKRASTACQACRIRKTKCDNAKPACSFCQYTRAQCIYTESIPEETYHDPASQEILRRLDYVTSLLEESRGRACLPEPSNEQNTHNGPIIEVCSSQWLPGTSGSVSSTRNTCTYDILGKIPSPISFSQALFTANPAESLLRWPIFRDYISDKDTDIQSFLLDTGLNREEPFVSQSSLQTQQLHKAPGINNRGVNEDDFVPLCKRFLSLVHSRNPILDGEELKQYAKDATEHGIGWNGPSCLVLLACALSFCMAPPSISPEPEDLDNIGPSVPINEDRSTEEAYFLAAKKRMGLLDSTPVDIQCFVLAATYERHAFRPLQSWYYIQQASCRLQSRLWRIGEKPPVTDSRKTREQYLEQRLYWSVVRAERELQQQIPLKSSGLEELNYPALFPSPPSAFSATGSESSEAGAVSPGANDEATHEEERSWFYYLSDISLGRIMDDIILHLYREKEHYREWGKDIAQLVKRCSDGDEQISLWYRHLPPPIQSEDASNQSSDNHLAFFLKGRYLEERQKVHWPLLYVALHYYEDHNVNSHVQQIAQLLLAGAQTCIDIAVELIVFYWRHFRHGGTWFALRSTFRAALILLAAVLSKGLVHAPYNWLALVRLSLATLSKWSLESADIRWMHSILERIVHEVLSRINGTG